MSERDNLYHFYRREGDQIQPPYFIYDLEKITGQIETIKNAFAGLDFTHYYPVKTNPCIDIVRYCLHNGLGLDACSMGDLDVADILNIPAEKITFTGVGLNEPNMHRLFKQNIIPNLNSPSEIDRWARLFPGSRIGIRLSTTLPASEHRGEYGLKMGIFPQDWPGIKKIILEKNLKIVKLHRHESSNSINYNEIAASFSTTFESVPPWVWKNIERINFGGGWGLPYLRKDALNVEKLVQAITSLTNKLKTFTASQKLKIEIEPGEFLVGYCGNLLTTVLDVRILPPVNNEKNLQVVILDTPFPITSGFRSPELLYPVDFKGYNKNENTQRWFTKIYGRSNTAMDTINKGLYAPEVTVGQAALVRWVGAYVPVLMSFFNQQDIPAEMILLNGKLMKSRAPLDFKSYYRQTYLEGVNNE